MGRMSLRRWARSFGGGLVSTGLERLNARHPWSHNDHFHSWILTNLPRPCGSVLDVGCGQGELLAALAPHAHRVVGVEIDDAVRVRAERRCAGLVNVSITGGRWSDVVGPFDAITMIAVLHHLDAEEALRDVCGLLSPGGRFLAVGLAVPRSFRDHAWDVASIVTNPLIGYVKHPWPSRAGIQPPPFPVKDPTMSFDELRDVVTGVMPGAVMRHHLGFRNTIAWTKP